MPESVPRKQRNSRVRGSTDPEKMNIHPSQVQSEDVWSRPNWPPRLEKVFVELLIEEMNRQLDVIPSGFKDESWDRVCEVFKEETSKNYDKAELKNHLVVLRKRYRIVKPLYNHGGFGWDYHRKMVDVDDSVWAEYIEVHPEIKPYRKWGCPVYEELCTIFTKPLATGEHAISSCGYRSHNTSNSRSRQNANVSGGNKKRHLENPSTSGPTKRNNNTKANATLGTQTASGPRDNPESAFHCITMVGEMQGVDKRLHNAAVDLFQNPSWIKIFMSLKSEKRLTWLKAMLPSVPLTR